MLQFTVIQLNQNELPSAWPLVRSVAPERDLQQWLDFANSLRTRGGGVMAVAAEGGTIQGVAAYRVVDRDDLGRLLHVDPFVTFELTRRAPVRRVLGEALERLARHRECRAVAAAAPGRGYCAYLAMRAQGGAQPALPFVDVVDEMRLCGTDPARES